MSRSENLPLGLQKLFEQWNKSVKDYHADLVSLMEKGQSRTSSAKTIQKTLHVPQDFKTITKALKKANPGDTILISNGTYHESITVPSDKPSVRFIANGDKVILNGKGKLKQAFTLMANDVEVNGFVIEDYVKSAIEVTGVYGVKLIENTIHSIKEGHGIQLDKGTFSNLIWKNIISSAHQDGINLQSKNVWVVDNAIRQNGKNGIRIQTIGNHIVGNVIQHNRASGILEDEGFNLIFDNEISENGKQGIDLPSSLGGSITLGNKVENNRVNGLAMNTPGNVALDNDFVGNERSGVHVEGKLNGIELNRFIENANGLVLEEKATRNLVFRNFFKRNRKNDLEVKNSKNTILQNHLSNSPPHHSAEGSHQLKSMVITVPNDYETISEAVNAAFPGTSILIENGVYHEEVAVPLSKSGIRIIANGNHVTLDGKDKLNVAFDLSSSILLIQGFKIKNYIDTGILVKGIGVSLVDNDIKNISKGNGIELSLAFSTLIWQNDISHALEDGIRIKAMNTWIVDNTVHSNGGNAVNYEGNTTVGSTVTRNRFLSNGMNGIADNAGFNFIYNNEINENNNNGVHEIAGLGSGAIIENKILANTLSGVRLNNEGDQVARNMIQFNLHSGVLVETGFHNLEENTITGNKMDGIVLENKAIHNLLLRNKVFRNNPFDVKVENRNNSFIQNDWGKSDPSDIFD
ncbi:right-handed parallel beta-helix repeat-containing protein [Guptibacillus algicola]|uniref:right-handed parallel beta-helix repeat-containing protein n=1 Tax=Guptibacillus algicola TaxID=225844 RepID=UPI001CD47B34|nr:right-handed parallel beta-helix repeat-containing protein [Alkalihalobacillus algicola]MCA0986547.1 right-handed parallel beta-helix repeat-containing protein [Alkalihalobacillus algicola]